MELRPYLDLLRRRIWFILEAVVVVALVAGVGSSLRTAKYTATASVVLQPDNPAEQLNPTQPNFSDPNRFVQAQVEIMESEGVAEQASRSLHGVTAKQIEPKVTVASSSASNVLKVSASDSDPRQARDIANAVVNGYIENRRQNAIVGLQQAAKDLDDKLASLQATMADLDAKIASATAAGASGAPAPNVDALKASRDAAATQFQTLYARQQELAVDISLQRGGAEVIAAAKTPTSPVSPRPLRDAAAGGFLGLLVGGGIVLLREQMDDRVRSVRDVERTLDLPILAQLPFDHESVERPHEVATIARPHSTLSEAVRSLRTSIQYMGLDHPVKVIVVTSAVPGEGKSVVSANLAAAYGQAGHRTVLVGADLRRSGLSRVFDVADGAPGLTDALVRLAGAAGPGSAGDVEQVPAENGEAPNRQGVARFLLWPARNLAFLPAGTTPANPAELLGSRRMKQLIEEMKGRADVIVIDTPPLLPVTDAAVLAACADGVVLVLAMDETRQEAARRAKVILESTQARILGVVVNKATKSAVPYYYGGYYGPPATNGSSPHNGDRRGGRAGSRLRRRATKS